MKRIYRLLAVIKKWPEIIWLPLLAISFFVAVSQYNIQTQTADFVKFGSPDETANYLEAKRFAQTGRLDFLEPDNITGEGIISPRSFRSDAGFLKPVSFLGIMIYYGSLAKIFGIASLPYITPVIASFGLIFFFLFVRKMFDRHVATVAVWLLACFPVYIYFSAHSFYHNIPFVVFTMVSLYFARLMLDKDRGFYLMKGEYWNFVLASLAGLFFGLAVAFRTSELLWLGPVIAILAICNWRKLGFIKPLIFIYFAFVAYSPVMQQNMFLYGAPFSSGYPKMDSSVSAIVSSGTGAMSGLLRFNLTAIKEYLQNLQSSIFVFGFNPGHSKVMFLNYLWRMFPWLLGLAGFFIIKIFFAGRKEIARRWQYLLVGAITSAILIFYYGSWIFYDNPDQSAFSIGNSYTRYWLPIYLFLIPLAAQAIIYLASFLRKKLFIFIGQIMAIAIILFFSISFVLVGSDEGLIFSAQRQVDAKKEWAQVLALTKPQDIIITRYHDKLLFPERRVIVGLLSDQGMNQVYAKLAKYNQVYYYSFAFPEKDLAYLNNSRLKEVGLKIEKIAQITKDFNLYRLYK